MGAAHQGILYPPEKPEVQPYEPPPDLDPGFEMPLPDHMQPRSFQIPGFNPFPWWDRRDPFAPLPDICMGLWTPGNTLGPAKPPPEVTERQEETARIGAELLSKAFRGLLPVLYYGSGSSRYICTGRGSSGGHYSPGKSRTVTTYDANGNAMMTYAGGGGYSAAATSAYHQAYNQAKASGTSYPVFAVDGMLIGGPNVVGWEDVNGDLDVVTAGENTWEYWDKRRSEASSNAFKWLALFCVGSVLAVAAAPLIAQAYTRYAISRVMQSIERDFAKRYLTSSAIRSSAGECYAFASLAQTRLAQWGVRSVFHTAFQANDLKFLQVATRAGQMLYNSHRATFVESVGLYLDPIMSSTARTFAQWWGKGGVYVPFIG